MTNFATAPRGGPGALRYAEACIKQGMSYQAAARAAGVNIEDLQAHCPDIRRPDRPAPNIAPLNAFTRCAAVLPDASASDLKNTVALALSLLADKEGRNAVVTATNTIIAALPHPLEIPVSPTRVTGHEIARSVAAHYWIAWPDFISARKTNAFAHPRHVAMYAMRVFAPHLSFPAIGRVLGGRDHSTIVKGVRSLERRVEANPDYAKEVAQVMTALRTRFAGRLAVAH